MAYVSFPELGGVAAMRPQPPGPMADPVPAVIGSFSNFEWSIVELARRDRLATLRQPGRLTRLWRMLARQPNPMLSNPRLEALRRMTVLSWHHGYTVASREVRAFLQAGYTADQYETLVDSVTAAKAVRGAW